MAWRDFGPAERMQVGYSSPVRGSPAPPDNGGQGLGNDVHAKPGIADGSDPAACKMAAGLVNPLGDTPVRTT